MAIPSLHSLQNPSASVVTMPVLQNGAAAKTITAPPGKWLYFRVGIILFIHPGIHYCCSPATVYHRVVLSLLLRGLAPRCGNWYNSLSAVYNLWYYHAVRHVPAAAMVSPFHKVPLPPSPADAEPTTIASKYCLVLYVYRFYLFTAKSAARAVNAIC